MLNQHLISPEIPTLHTSDQAEAAIHTMEEAGTRQLAVIENGQYLGLISEDDLLDASPGQLLADLHSSFLPFSVFADDHFLTGANILVGRKLGLMPVVFAGNEYAGSISQENMLRQLATHTGALQGGAMIVAEMEPLQYSISEISKLAETNDAHITQLNTQLNETTGHVRVTIRLNKQDVSDVVATLQRYDYNILFYSGEEHYENELRRNYHHLMNFITM
jgi:CBS domain-containing protein